MSFLLTSQEVLEESQLPVEPVQLSSMGVDEHCVSRRPWFSFFHFDRTPLACHGHITIGSESL